MATQVECRPGLDSQGSQFIFQGPKASGKSPRLEAAVHDRLHLTRRSDLHCQAGQRQFKETGWTAVTL
jgi:hypothetical protein